MFAVMFPTEGGFSMQDAAVLFTLWVLLALAVIASVAAIAAVKVCYSLLRTKSLRVSRRMWQGALYAIGIAWAWRSDRARRFMLATGVAVVLAVGAAQLAPRAMVPCGTWATWPWC